MTGTAFGPQGFGASTSLPAGVSTNRYGTGVDTWVQDCDASGGNSTILDAAFFNMILGNMRHAVKQAVAEGATIPLVDGDMSLLWQAIKAGGNQFSTGPGLELSGGVLSLNPTTLKVMVA